VQYQVCGRRLHQYRQAVREIDEPEGEGLVFGSGHGREGREKIV